MSVELAPPPQVVKQPLQEDMLNQGQNPQVVDPFLETDRERDAIIEAREAGRISDEEALELRIRLDEREEEIQQARINQLFGRADSNANIDEQPQDNKVA